MSIQRKCMASAGIFWLMVGAVTLALSGRAGAAPKADPAHGQQVFARCAACHVVGPATRTAFGPALNGVVGRPAGTLAGYRYSPAMQNSHLKWNDASLAAFLQAPMKTVPGTKMAFPGLANAQDQADVIAYLKQYRADGTKK